MYNIETHYIIACEKLNFPHRKAIFTALFFIIGSADYKINSADYTISSAVFTIGTADYKKLCGGFEFSGGLFHLSGAVAPKKM